MSSTMCSVLFVPRHPKHWEIIRWTAAPVPWVPRPSQVNSVPASRPVTDGSLIIRNKCLRPAGAFRRWQESTRMRCGSRTASVRIATFLFRFVSDE